MTLTYLTGDAAHPDWGALHRFLQDCFAYMDGRIDPPSSLQRMTPESLAAKARDEVLILCLNGADIAGCGFAVAQGDVLYLGKLAVAPACRRQGILRRIVEIAEDQARTQDLRALQLQTRVELVENHATFAALGFRQTGTTAHPGYDRPTSIFMEKPL